MTENLLMELLLPFLGTSLGAGCVFFLKKGMSPPVQRALTGFAAGVMVAASLRSLDFGWVSCSCWCWIGRSPICIKAATSRRAPQPS